MSRNLTVGELEARMLTAFPREDAAEWDRTGLICGDPEASVKRVAVALDPTVAAIRLAADAGCNVLVTHHPAFLDPPEVFSPADSVARVSGAGIYEAVSRDVALINFHTALDFNPRGYRRLPDLLELEVNGLLEELGGSTGKNGYGCVSDVPADDSLTVSDLATRCKEVFHVGNRLWGDPDCLVSRIAFGQGSASSLAQACVAAHVTCLVCGEIKYHTALDLIQAGVSVIELGHDISEFPLVDELVAELTAIGIPIGDVEYLQQSNWTMA